MQGLLGFFLYALASRNKNTPYQIDNPNTGFGHYFEKRREYENDHGTSLNTYYAYTGYNTAKISHDTAPATTTANGYDLRLMSTEGEQYAKPKIKYQNGEPYIMNTRGGSD